MSDRFERVIDHLIFGHAIVGFGPWFFRDNGEEVTRESVRRRLCPKCKKPQTPEGHDPCIANLPGVRYACCGHGIETGYILFENGLRIGMNVTEVEVWNRELTTPTRLDVPDLEGVEGS